MAAGGNNMYGIVDVITIALITFIGTVLICMFIASTSRLRHEEEAYQAGYDKGYADGKKARGE